MKTIEILDRLEGVNFSTEQARTITEIFEERQSKTASTRELEKVEDNLMAEIRSVSEEVKAVDTRLTAEIKAVDKRFSAEIRSLSEEVKAVDKRLTAEIKAVDKRLTDIKFDLVKWILGAMVINIGVVCGIIFFLIKYLSS